MSKGLPPKLPKRVGEEETHPWDGMECVTAAFKRRVQMCLVFGACYKEGKERQHPELLSAKSGPLVPRSSKQVRAVVSPATNPTHTSSSGHTWLPRKPVLSGGSPHPTRWVFQLSCGTSRTGDPSWPGSSLREPHLKPGQI